MEKRMSNEAQSKESHYKNELLDTHAKKQNLDRFSKTKYEEKIVQIKRVTKVVKGGKKMTFWAIVIVGDNQQKVGVGVGRADDVNLAIDKAVLHGKKNLITVPLTRARSIPHVAGGSFGACHIMLRPAAEGSGIIAGGPIKTVLELAGFKNLLAKQFGSKNILNNAKATIATLNKLNECVELAKFQSLRMQSIYERRMIKNKENNA